MRRFALSLLISAFMLSGISLVAAAGAASEDTWLSETWSSVKDFTIEQKDKAVAESQSAMDTFDAQMDQLDAEASTDSAEMSAGWENTKAELSDLRAKAQSKLDQLGDASADTWDDVKQEFGDAVQELEDAYNKARSDL